ncbi:hypothetical protein SLS62_002504 [Diatrype stigma]|uniref:Xylanolytic transcriptional activator regulatory domain-containing protein n=1 Tax=Diatrype stigma TaxID=117547 RepID=A0AAN9YVP6_9PEZI
MPQLPFLEAQVCKNRNRDCVYPVRDKLLTVPESYLRGLERQVHLSRHSLSAVVDDNNSSGGYEVGGGVGVGVGSATSITAARESPPQHQQPLPTAVSPQTVVGDGLQQSSLEDCSAEGFVRRLRELSLAPESGGGGVGGSGGIGSSGSSGSGNLLSHHARHSANHNAPSYTYSRLNFDVIQPDVSFKLPPRQYAFHLLSVFEEGFCDYHWFLRKRFRERLALTYASPSSQSRDRNWLCRVSVVLALAETWNRGRSFLGAAEQPTAALPPPLLGQQQFGKLGGGGGEAAGDSGGPPLPPDVPLNPQPRLPPGSEFFEQGLLLLKLTLEEPIIEDVEALNLIAFYCYSLNRRNSAYLYAAQSISLAKLLGLDKPELPRDLVPEQAGQERVVQEHRKRVWWTSYCMNRMVSTELGIPPAHEPASRDLQLPSSAHLARDEEEEFFDSKLLTAQTQLCQIKFKVVETASHHIQMSADGSPLDILGPCLTTLQEWRQHLPRGMSFTFDNGIPKEMLELPAARVVASLYLRYHQNPETQAGGSPLGSLEHMAPSGNSSDLVAMKLQCIGAARNNCRILVDLWRCGKIAKYGYWESLHLFSGLSILLLSRVVFSDATNGLYATPGFSCPNDAELYTMARSLLEDMARLGNPASKDHEALLTDVEQVVEMVTSRQQQREPPQPQGIVPPGVGQQQQQAGVGGGGHWLETIGTDDGVPLDHFWQDVEWETMLSNYTRATPNQQ